MRAFSSARTWRRAALTSRASHLSSTLRCLTRRRTTCTALAAWAVLTAWAWPYHWSHLCRRKSGTLQHKACCHVAIKGVIRYHTCASRGKSCANTKLVDQGGCAIWYNELEVIVMAV